jgi:hypothetical protein
MQTLAFVLSRVLTPMRLYQAHLSIFT